MKDSIAATKLRLEVLEIPIATLGLSGEERCEDHFSRPISHVLQEKDEISQNASTGTLAISGSRVRQKIIYAKILSREQEGTQNGLTTVNLNGKPDQTGINIPFDSDQYYGQSNVFSSNLSTIVTPVTIVTIALSTCTASKTESDSSQNCTSTTQKPQTEQHTLSHFSDLDQKCGRKRSCSDDVHKGMLNSELVSPEDSSIPSEVDAVEVNNFCYELGTADFWRPERIEEAITGGSISKNSQMALEERESGALKDDENMIRGNSEDYDQTTKRQIRELRLRICEYDVLGDVSAVERTYQEALRIDPTDIGILTNFAVFLHSQKGNFSQCFDFVALCAYYIVNFIGHLDELQFLLHFVLSFPLSFLQFISYFMSCSVLI